MKYIFFGVGNFFPQVFLNCNIFFSLKISPESINLFLITHNPTRPFSIMLVNLAFNAIRNSHIKPKKC